MGLFHRHHWFISSVQPGHYGLLLAPMEDTRCTTVFRRCRFCPRVKSNILTGHRTIDDLYESGHFKRTSPPSRHTSDGSTPAEAPEDRAAALVRRTQQVVRKTGVSAEEAVANLKRSSAPTSDGSSGEGE